MTRGKIVLWAALGGAAAGVLATKGRWHVATDRALPEQWQFWAAVIGWVVFSLYWEVAAKGAGAAKSSESQGSRGVHVALTNVALLLELAPVRGLGRLVPMSFAIMTAGVVVEAMGLFLAIWARRHLGRNWSGEITIKVEHELVRSGPYRRLRHPIYTGLLAMYAGAAMVNGGWLAAVGLGVAVFAYWRKIRLEEENLQVAFGGDYEEYRRETWALVPGVY